MKKLANTSFFYGMLGIFAGAFYREFTKFIGFVGETRMSLTHGHILGLGMLFFLIVTLLEKNFNLSEDGKFKRFYGIYNVSILAVFVVFYLKGFWDIYDYLPAKGLLAAIDGIAGIFHILLTYSLIVFFNILRRRVEIE